MVIKNDNLKQLLPLLIVKRVVDENPKQQIFYLYHANNCFAELIKKTAAEIKGYDILQIISPQEAALDLEKYICNEISFRAILSNNQEFQVSPIKLTEDFFVLFLFSTTQKYFGKERQLLELLFEHAELGFVYIDSLGMIIECNQKLAEIIGAPVDVIIGTNALTLPAFDVVEMIKKGLQGEKATFEGAYTSITSNKKSNVAAIFAPVFNNEGIVEGVLGIIDDLSPLKTAYNQVENLNKKLNLALESTDSGVWELQFAKEEYIWDQKTQQLLFAKEQQFQGSFQDFALNVCLEDQPILKQKITDSLMADKFFVEIRVKNAEGSLEWRSIDGKVIYEHNEPKHVLGTIRNIDYYKQVELKLKERIRELSGYYAVSSDMNQSLSLSEFAKKTAQNTCQMMSFPEAAVTTIRIENQDFVVPPKKVITDNFLTAPLKIANVKKGDVKVSYLEDVSFLIPEEQHTLDNVAYLISLWLERYQNQKSLEDKAEHEALVSEISGLFIDVRFDDRDQVMAQAVQKIGQFLKIDRVYVQLLSQKDDLKAIYWQWQRDQENKEKVKQYYLDWTEGSTLNQQLKQQKFIAIEDTSQAKLEHQELAAELAKKGIKSFLACPLMLEQQINAVLILEAQQSGIKWSFAIKNLIKMISETMVSFLSRLRIENHLKKSEERFRNFVESSSDIFLKLSKSGKFLYVSPNVSYLLGFAAAEVLDKKVADFVHPEDYQELVDDFAGIMKSKMKRGEFECRICNKKGLWRYYNFRVYKEQLGKRIILNGIARDISRQKMVENALAESEARFRNILQDVQSVAVEGIDEQGTIIYWNKASENLYGYTQAEALGEKFLDLIVPKSKKQQFREMLTQAFEQKNPLPPQEMKMQKKDGAEIVIYSSTSLINDDKVSLELYFFDIDVSEQKKTEQELQRLASTDFLTGLFNRRYFIHFAEKELERFKRYQNPFALLIIDIDYFKNVNDTYGHAAGDKTLIAVAQKLRENLRSADVLGRIGGEEFAVILPNSALKEAYLIAERIRLDLAKTPTHYKKQKIFTTVSIGVTATTKITKDFDQLFKLADDALYQAKKAGRNRVETLENA